MAATSRTDVTAFRRMEKTSRICSQKRSKESRDSSNWLEGINSNAIKRSKGSHSNATERSISQKRHANAAVKRSRESHLSVGNEGSHLNTEEHLDLHYSNTANEEHLILNEREHSRGRHLLSAEENAQESHLSPQSNDDDQSDASDSSAPQKQPAKRDKKSASEGIKRLKPCATKKDTSWKQNSRSRRLVANARERSRIHILSDAFENLRRAVPSYSQDQKLSKLAILKLATYYISALANLAESDTSARSLKQFGDCVAHCTKALQTEGRSRRKQF